MGNPTENVITGNRRGSLSRIAVCRSIKRKPGALEITRLSNRQNQAHPMSMQNFGLAPIIWRPNIWCHREI